ncbi:MAG: hypothetical protein OSA98_25910, partial [Rubripirellula sp.]|nr:hypothetical protein [Rubripirellula sp.]
VETISAAEAVASTGTIAAYGDYRIAETNVAVTFHRQRADAEEVYANQLIAADKLFVGNVSVATTAHDEQVATATGHHHGIKSDAQTERWLNMYAVNLIGMYQAYLGIPSNQINTTSEEIDVARRYIDVVVPADKALQDALSEASKTLHKTMASETETQIKSKAAAGLTLAESLADSLFTFDTSLATRYEQLQTTLANISYVFATGWIGADAAFSKAVNEADRVLAHATSENHKTLEINIAERERQAVITWANEDGYVTLDEQYSIDMHAAEVDWITNTATLSTGYETFAADEYKKLSDKLVEAQQTAAVQGEDALKNHRHNMASKVRAKAESVSQALTTEAKDSAKAATTLITDTAAANRTFAESVADAVHTYKTGVASKQASAEAGLKGDKASEHSGEIDAATYESRKAAKEQQLQLALSQLIVERAGEFAKATDTWGEEFTRAGEQNTVDQSKVVKQRVNSVLDAGISYLTGMNAENSTLRIAYRTADEGYVVSAAEAEQQNVTNTGAAWTSLISDRGAENVAWAQETAGYEVDYVIASAQNDAQKKRSEAGDSPTRAERFQIRVADSRIDYLQSVSGAFVTHEVSAAENASKQDSADAAAAEKLDNDIGSSHLTYVQAASSQYLARYTAASGHGVTYGNALANQYGAHIVTDAGAHHTAVITAASGVRSGGYEFAKADANYYSETAKYAHLSLNHVYGSEGSTSPSKDYLEDYNTAVANATYTAQSARVNAAATRTTTVLQADLDYALGVADLDHDYTIGIAAEQKALAVFNAGAAQTLSHGVADAFESHDLSQASAAHDRIIEDAEALETALMKQYTEAKQVYHTFDDVLDVEVQYAIGVVDGNLAWAEVAGPAFIAHQTAIADANLSYVETVSGHATLARKSMADAEKTYGVSQATTNYDATVASSEAGNSVKVQLAAASFILHTQRNSADSALKLAQLGLQRDAKIDAGWGNDPVIDADKLQQARDAATQKKSSASGSHDAKLAELRQSYHQSTTEIYRDSGKAQADHGLVIDLAMAGIAKSYDDALNDASRDHRKAVIDADQDHAIAAIDAEIAGLWGRAHSFHSD